MHAHNEIIMPYTDNIEEAIAEILKPFNENHGDENYCEHCCEYENRSGHEFWDFYIIGGRWSGNHILSKFDPEKILEFHQKLTDMEITVSGLQWGKQELNPSNQVEIVDELWREHFPEGGDTCPIFQHYNDQYKHNVKYPDVIKLKDIPPYQKASRVLIAGISPRDHALKTEYRIDEDYWNGVCHIDSNWDKKVTTAIEMHLKIMERYSEEWKEAFTPTDDWLLVTVDTHS